MTPEELQAFIAQGEGQSIEFKRSVAEREVGARAATAMANAGGGHVLFGVRNDGTVDGVQIGNQTKERVANEITGNTDPTLYPSVEHVDLDDLTVIVASVPESEDKPHLFKGRAYKRVGATDVQMSRIEYERLLRERPGAEYDGQVLARATMDDIDWGKVEHYLAMRERVTGSAVTISPQQVLQARNCLVESEGVLRPTVAGILLFGMDPQAFLSRSYITIIRFRGRDTAHGYYDRRDLMGTLPEMIDAADTYLWEHIQHGGRVISLRREDLHEYPGPALRECLVNAVAHRDYSVLGSRIIVSVFEDRIAFDSPGPLPGPITVENILERQFSRNPRIVRILFEMGYIEEVGMGLDNVYRWLRESGQPEPALWDTGDSFIVTLYGLDIEKVLAQDDSAGVDLAAMGLNERQIRAIEYIQERGKISNREYREIGKVSHEMAYRELSALADLDLVEKRGAGRGSHYILVDD